MRTRTEHQFTKVRYTLCLQMVSKRPVSPHVFEVDQPTKAHYKMPMNAVSSIMTRATGCVLSASAFQSPTFTPLGPMPSI